MCVWGRRGGGEEEEGGRYTCVLCGYVCVNRLIDNYVCMLVG